MHDLPGARQLLDVGSWYAGGMDQLPPTFLITRLWTFAEANSPGSPTVRWSRLTTIKVCLLNPRAVTAKWLNPSSLDVLASAGARHGYRTSVIAGDRTTRVVIDITR